METLKWSLFMEIYGRMDAELVKSYLEANGIDAELFQESVEQIRHPVSHSRVQIFVPTELLNEARRLYAETGWMFEVADEENDEEN